MTARLGLDTRLALARLYVVADGRGGATPLRSFADAVFAAGADVVEVKDPSLRRDGLLERLTAARAAALTRDRLVVVHADARLAADFVADALLLADDATSASDARRSLHAWALVGRSCNTTAEIDAALADPDVSFLLVGPGLDHLRHAAEAAPAGSPGAKPWFAAGGVTPQTLDLVLEAGARRIAVGSAVTRASDPAAVVAELAGRLREVWNADPALTEAQFAAFDRGGLTFPEGPPRGPRGDGLHL